MKDVWVSWKAGSLRDHLRPVFFRGPVSVFSQWDASRQATMNHFAALGIIRNGGSPINITYLHIKAHTWHDNHDEHISPNKVIFENI